MLKAHRLRKILIIVSNQLMTSALKITSKVMAGETGFASGTESLSFKVALKDPYSRTLWTREDGQETDGC